MSHAIELAKYGDVTAFQARGYPHPEEAAAIDFLSRAFSFVRTEAVEWAISSGLVKGGDISCVEDSPTFRCPEACTGCKDSQLITSDRIKAGELPFVEPRAPVEVMNERRRYLYELGVRHFMVIGGTVDGLPDLSAQMKYLLELGPDNRASWFTDCIPQIDEQTGMPSALMQQYLNQGWLHMAATHLSLDYPYGYSHEKERLNLFDSLMPLPPKKARLRRFEDDSRESRVFKSQYGWVGARRLIEAGVRRVVGNTAITPDNLDFVSEMYEQVGNLSEYGKVIGSPTEVLWTFSDWQHRPYHRPDDNPKDNPPRGGIQYDDVEQMNAIFQVILDDTYERIHIGRPRILANSSGFTFLHAISNEEYRRIVVEQDLPYESGRPEMYQILPDGTIWCDPMVAGPELVALHSTYGYRDRVFIREKNPFSIFHRDGDDQEWFPNIITT